MHTGLRVGDFYPRSPRGEQPYTAPPSLYGAHFYPRSPRGERLPVPRLFSPLQWPFLSTLPARGATLPLASPASSSRFLSTLPARGATPKAGTTDIFFGFLSTLPARGATYIQHFAAAQMAKFLSTLPARGATIDGHRRSDGGDISIHAPREGSDEAATGYRASWH